MGPTRQIFLAISFVLIAIAGIASGLTVGLLSIDPMNLAILETEGTEEEKKYAQLLKPIISKHHLLLVNLLLTNAVCMESLPIFLDKVVPEVVAIILSVSAVLVFGEIVPQAICTGPKRLQIGAFFAPTVRVVMIVLCPIATPIAKLLDKLLGEEHMAYYRRQDLRALVNLHGADAAAAAPDGSGHGKSQGPLTTDEVTILRGTLQLANKTVKEVMQPWASVHAISQNAILDSEAMARWRLFRFSSFS